MRDAGVVASDPLELILPSRAGWRRWLTRNHDHVDGVWLVLAKKDTTEPTRLRYDDALDEALCFGWIDGQVQRRDAATAQNITCAVARLIASCSPRFVSEAMVVSSSCMGVFRKGFFMPPV